jgi:hypothetical protein
MLEVLGVIFLVVIAIALIGALVALIASASDLQRYLHMRRM